MRAHLMTVFFGHLFQRQLDSHSTRQEHGRRPGRVGERRILFNRVLGAPASDAIQNRACAACAVNIVQRVIDVAQIVDGMSAIFLSLGG